MTDLDKFFAFKSTSNSENGGDSGKNGCSMPFLLVIVLVFVFIGIFGRC